jgi:hypothetical protein
MEKDLKETITHRGIDIKVYYDTEASSPNEDGSADAFVVFTHRSFEVQVEGFKPIDIYEHIQKTNKFFYDGCFVFPLYAYIHSGVALSLGNTKYPFNDRWDVSNTGFIVVRRVKGWTWTRAKALKIAEGICSMWNEHLGGETYGYMCDTKKGKHIGSCWGFCGDDGYNEMITEAKAGIDAHLDSK